MKRFIIFTAFLLILLIMAKVLDGAGIDGPCLGEAPPGDEPSIFAPGVVSLEDRTDYVISFGAGGREVYF